MLDESSYRREVELRPTTSSFRYSRCNEEDDEWLSAGLANISHPQTSTVLLWRGSAKYLGVHLADDPTFPGKRAQRRRQPFRRLRKAGLSMLQRDTFYSRASSRRGAPTTNSSPWCSSALPGGGPRAAAHPQRYICCRSTRMPEGQPLFPSCEAGERTVTPTNTFISTVTRLTTCLLAL